MIWTAHQTNTFFEHADQMSILHATVDKLQAKGITTVALGYWLEAQKFPYQLENQSTEEDDTIFTQGIEQSSKRSQVHSLSFTKHGNLC